MANTDKELEDLRNDLNTLKAQLKDLSADGGDVLASARSKLEAEADKLMEGLRSAGSTAADKGERLLHKTEDKIGENPWGSVVVTLGVGVVIGMLLRRR